MKSKFLLTMILSLFFVTGAGSLNAQNEAKIGVTEYATLEDAIAAANADDDEDEVVLLKDVTIESKIDVTKSLVLNGNNKTLTYTGSDRAIDVRKETNGANLTVKNLSVQFEGNYRERGINYNTTGKLTLENVIVGSEDKHPTYAVNLPGSCDNATIDVDGCVFYGKNTFNVWGENCTITIDGTNITSVDNANSENYVAVYLNNDGITSAEGTVITINGGSIVVATDENGNPSAAVRNNTETGVINISESTEIIGGTTESSVAIVYYNGTDNVYSCSTLQSAINKAIESNAAGVRLIKNVTSNEVITINGNLNLDLKGKTVTGTANRLFRITKASAIVTITNGTIENNVAEGRCIETRAGGINLTLENLTLNTTGNKSQPFTVGGNSGTDGNVIVNMKETNVNAGINNSYAITTFNPVVMTIEDSSVEGWAALNIKGIDGSLGSKGSTFNINNSTLRGINNAAPGATNNFSTIMIEDSNITLNIDGNSSIAYAGSNSSNVQFIFGIGNEIVESIVENTKINVGVGATLDGIILGIHEDQSFSVAIEEMIVPAAYAEQLIAEGYVVSEAVDGLIQVTGVAVAKIGTTYYTTLEAAIEAATSGQTVTLLKDVVIESYIHINKNVNIDLNGETITREIGDIFYIKPEENADNAVEFTVGNGELIAGNIAVWSRGDGEHANKVNINNVTIESGKFAVYHNGSNYGSDVTIANSNITAAEGRIAVYLSGSESWNNAKSGEKLNSLTINNSTIKGATAVEVKYGNITITDSELIATSEEQTVVDNGNGGCTIGYALALTNNPSASTVGSINLNGENTLTGGVIVKAEGAVDVTTNSADLIPAPEGYYWNEGILVKVTNTDAEAVIGTTYYTTLEAAIEAAQTGDEVVLLKNLSLSSKVSVAGKNITLNLNGKTITANFSDSYGAIYVKKGAELTIQGEGTITSSGIVIGTYGTVNIQGGEIITTNNNVEHSTSLYVFYHTSDYQGTANISGGHLNRVWNCGTLNITDGKIDYLDTSSELTIGADAEITTMIAKNGADAGGPYEMQIADINVIENITLEEGYILVEVGEDVYQVVPNNAEALIGTTSYSTLEDAIAAANADDDEDEVVLLKDVTIESKIDVTESLVLNGNNKTLTYTGSDRAIDVRKETDGANLTVRNLTINCAANWCERGINYNTTGTLTLDGVTIEGKTIKSINYGVNFPGYADGAIAIIENSKITNFMPINIWGSNMNVTITDSEIYSYSTSNDAGGGIVLNIDAEHSAEGTQVYMIGGKLHAYFIDDENNYTPGYAVRKEVNNTTLVNISNTTDLYGTIENGLTVATVRYGDSPYFYSYETLKEAVEKAILDYSNGITNVRVEVVKDAEGSGIFIEKDLDLNLTIDFKNHTYTFTEPAVGSTGTVSQGFHIEKGNKITLKNGTLNVHTDYDRLYAMLIQNYADLTIIDMTLDGDNLDRYKDKDYNYSYVLSNNCGTVNISGNTNIIANPGDEGENHHGVAFDVCKYANYEAPVVTVNTTGKIQGVVEVSAVLNLEAVGTNNISRIDISGEGQLYHNVEGIQGTIKRTFENNANDNPEDDWYTIAVPFEGHEVSALQTTTDYALYRYNESAALWENVKVSDNNFLTLDLGRGYIYANAATTDFEFSGEFNVKPVTYTLTLQSQVEDLKGFHLIGNPFAHDITMSHLTGKTLADGFYVLSNDGAWSAKSSLDKIAAGQGALIKTTEEGALTIVKNVSSKSREVNNGQLMINVANSRYNDVAYVSFNKGIGLNKIAHRNAEIPMVYVPVNGENYAVATMSNEVTEIPVSFEAKTMGEYTISVEAQDCEFAQMYLIDKMTGYSTNLLLEDYTFMAKSGDNAERFVIRLVNSFDHSFGAENFIIFSNDEMMINDIQGEGVIRIVDVLGRPVAEYNVFGSANISTTSFRSGAYMIQVIDDSGVKVQKIIID